MKKIIIIIVACLLLVGGVTAVIIITQNDKPHTHAYGEWKTDTAATCTADGTKTRTCDCGESERAPIPATGHSFGAWGVTTPATCVAGVETRFCACGGSETRPIAGNGIHVWNTQNVCDGCEKQMEYTEELMYFAEGEAYLVDGLDLNCEKTAIVIPPYHNGKPVIGIANGAFTGRTSIVSIEMPASVVSIGSGAFMNCTSLAAITLNEGTLAIGQNAFSACTSLATITIPASVVQIDAYAFNGCTSLAEVVFLDGNTLQSIGARAFKNCKKLTAIAIPDSVMMLCDSAFEGCYALQTVGIGRNSLLEAIGSRAFYDCGQMMSITIPSGVTMIGSDAFLNCEKLVEIFDLSETLSFTIGRTDNGYVAYYAKVIHTSPTATSAFYTDANGFLFIDNGTVRYLIGYTGSETVLTLPADCNGAGYIVGEGALSGVGVTSLTIPAGVTALEGYAFRGMETLVSVVFAEGCAITQLPNSLFKDCTALASVTLPASVNRMGFDVFAYCGELTHITFRGTVDAWQALMDNSFSWDGDTGNYTVQCSNGTVAKDGTVTVG